MSKRESQKIDFDSSLSVLQIPELRDNFSYLIINAETKECAIVDPPLAENILKEITLYQLNPIAILNTHHHADHVGGNFEIKNRYPKIKIYGPAADRERIPEITHALEDSFEIPICGTKAKFLDVPGHTRGHGAYFFERDQALFCGDTVFSIGCGRLFEGTAEQMVSSFRKIMKLPSETQIFCAHEYTLNNIQFAKWLTPNLGELVTYEDECKKIRSSGGATIPTTLARELALNPFFKFEDQDFQNQVAQAHDLTPVHDPVKFFAQIRKMKDGF